MRIKYLGLVYKGSGKVGSFEQILVFGEDGGGWGDGNFKSFEQILVFKGGKIDSTD